MFDPTFDFDPDEYRRPTRKEAEADARESERYYRRHPVHFNFPDPWEQYKNEPEYTF